MGDRTRKFERAQTALPLSLKATYRYSSASKGKKKSAEDDKPRPLITSHKETLDERLRRLSRQRESEARIKNNIAKSELRRELASVNLREYESMKLLSREITEIECESRQIARLSDRQAEITHLQRRLESRAGSGMCPRFRMRHIKHECTNPFSR